MKKIIFIFCTIVSVLKADFDSEELKETVCATLPSLEGWCSQEKACEFIDLVLAVKPDLCVEIGVFGGSSLFPVASALKCLEHGKVIGIDPWDKIECIKYFDPVRDAEHLKWWGSLNINYIYHSYQNMIKKHNLSAYVHTIRATSEEAASQIGTIDILYIDGNHSEECSLNDVMLYLPKVRSGGYIWMNDSLWIERQEAVDILVENCEVVKLIDKGNCILFQKR